MKRITSYLIALVSLLVPSFVFATAPMTLDAAQLATDTAWVLPEAGKVGIFMCGLLIGFFCIKRLIGMCWPR